MFYLSNYERIQIMTSTFIFLVLFLLFRTMILGYIPNSLHIIVMTLLFFIWYSLSLAFTNAISFNRVKKNLKVE